MERLDDWPVRSPTPNAALLVGRTREQTFLREELGAAIGGRGRLILLGGEAGIGKTTLAKDVAREAAAQGATVLTGYCYDLTNTPPYGPWLDLVAAYRPAGPLPAPPAAFTGGSLTEVASQAELFAEVGQFVADLATAKPAVVLLEDLHWADPASLELLRAIAPRSKTLPLLLIVTYRVDEITRHHPFYQHLPALIREANGIRLDLHRLDSEALHALVSARFSLPQPDRERLVAHLEEHAEGNPFFATELLRALQEDQRLQATGRGWTLGELDRFVVPPLLRQVIDVRVARLGEQTRQPLAIAAVIGQETPLDLWATVAGIGEEELLAIVEQAVDAHLLEAMPDGVSVRFAHALIREALYESVLPPRRRLLHQQVAAALIAGANPDPDTVAFHLQQAGDAEAVTWLIQAGERAQRAYAWLTAVERYNAATRLLAGVAGQERLRGWLLFRSARLRRYSSPAESIADLAEAERLALRSGDDFLRADARHTHGLLLCYADDYTRGVRLMNEGRLLHEARTDPDELPFGPARLWLADALPPSRSDLPTGADEGEAALRAQGLHYRSASSAWPPALGGGLDAAKRSGEAFVAVATSAGPPSDPVRIATGHAFHGLGAVYAGLGRPADARTAFRRARAAYDVLEHHAVIAFSLLNELRDVVIPYSTDRPAERRQLADEAAAAISRAQGAFVSGVMPSLGRLCCQTIDGEWDEAVRTIEETPPPGIGLLRRELTSARAAIAYGRGETEVLRSQIFDMLPEGPDMPPGSRIHQEALFLQRLAIETALDCGDLDTARVWIESQDRWLDWSGGILGRAEGQLLRARWRRAAGDSSLARSCAESARHQAVAPRQPLVLIGADRLLGQLALDAGDTAAAERHLAAALVLAEACAAPFERALSLLALAEVRITSGRLDDAARLLEDVRAICLPLGARPTLARAESLAARLAGSPVSFPAGLSAREVEVLRLLADGLTDREIADILFLSPRTVATHLRSVYDKIDVSSRAAATRYAIEHGLT